MRLDKQYIKFLILKGLNYALMVIAMFLFLNKNSTMQHYILGAVFLITAFWIHSIEFRMPKPPLSKCMSNVPFGITLIFHFVMVVSYGVMVLSFSYVVFVDSPRLVALGWYSLILFLITSLIYFYRCKMLI